MSTQFVCTIHYQAKVKIATAVLNAPVGPDGAYDVKDGDTILFKFEGPGATQAWGGFFIAPKKSTGVAPTAIEVKDGSVLHVDYRPGIWCFFMLFYAGADGGLHIVPDPELQVGS